MLTHRFRQLSLPAAVSRSHVSSTTTPLAPVTPAARPRVLDLQRHRAERAEVPIWRAGSVHLADLDACVHGGARADGHRWSYRQKRCARGNLVEYSNQRLE